MVRIYHDFFACLVRMYHCCITCNTYNHPTDTAPAGRREPETRKRKEKKMRVIYLQPDFEPEIAWADGLYCPVEFLAEVQK